MSLTMTCKIAVEFLNISNFFLCPAFYQKLICRYLLYPLSKIQTWNEMLSWMKSSLYWWLPEGLGSVWQSWKEWPQLNGLQFNFEQSQNCMSLIFITEHLRNDLTCCKPLVFNMIQISSNIAKHNIEPCPKPYLTL